MMKIEWAVARQDEHLYEFGLRNLVQSEAAQVVDLLAKLQRERREANADEIVLDHE